MSTKSDLVLNASKFDPKSIEKEVEDFNVNLIKIMESGPSWWEVGAAKYRQMRWNGETPLPKPLVLEDGVNSTIPSREKGRDITCRIFKPSSGPPKCVFMHIHGGGWVLQSEAYQDPLLRYFSDAAQATVVSIGYRLAPEHPFPSGPEDCFDAAEWLVDNAKEKFGAELWFIAGESAGAHLSAVTCLHVIKSRPNFKFRGLVLSYGAYDVSNFAPQVFQYDRKLVLYREVMDHFAEASFPNTTVEQRRDPMYSPLYANLRELGSKCPGGTLPPAFFVCGTEDPLLDDTVFMSAKWMMSGGEAVVKIYPGSPHGFNYFPLTSLKSSGQFREDCTPWLQEKMRG